MDYVIDLDPTHRVLRCTVTSAFTDVGCTELYRTLKRLASWDGPYAGILDLNQAPAFPISSNTIRVLAALEPAIPAGRPRVIVAAEAVMYGLARMFELIRDSMGGELQVVRSLEEAYDMLGVRPEDFTRRVFPEDLAELALI
jgi:hypothetical protein